MSDREAFVSAIAANPADDLPRLVFADWLDEHGEPERAEFIRTQIRWHHADQDERKQLDVRASDLFRDHWKRWFGPFVYALSPSADLDFHYRFHPRPGGRIYVSNPYGRESGLAVMGVSIDRGFVDGVNLDLDHWGGRPSLAEAFQRESPHSLSCVNGMHAPVWNRFTDPVLRRVEWLSLTQQWAWNVSAPDSGALLHDPHLAGVRQFNLNTEPETDGEYPPLPVAWLEAFTRSPLAYRLTGLCLPNTDGIAPLCRPGRLHLERLELGGQLNADSVRRLGGSELSTTVRELMLNAAGLDNTAASDLARDDWRKLTRLELQRNELSAAVLPALAAAAFTPRLEVLKLSHNPLFTGEERDLARLAHLTEALDPDRLEHLDLSDTGLSAVPDFLAERFGDRVTV